MSMSSVAAHAAAFWAALLFGASVVATRIVAQDVPPFTLAVLRFAQGGLILALGALVVDPASLYVRRRDVPVLLLLGAVLFAVFPVAFNVGLRLTTASRGALMLATMPLWTAVLAWVLRRERLDARQLVGVLLTIIGVGIVLTERGLTWGETAETMAGEGLMLLTALCGALYSVLAKPVLARSSALTVTVYAMLFGTLLLLPGALAEGLAAAVAGLDTIDILLLLFLGILGGAIGYLGVTFSLTRLAPTQATVYINLNPVVATALAGLLLHEQLTLAFAVGLIAVLCGVLLVNGPQRSAGSRVLQPRGVTR